MNQPFGSSRFRETGPSPAPAVKLSPAAATRAAAASTPPSPQAPQRTPAAPCCAPCGKGVVVEQRKPTGVAGAWSSATSWWSSLKPWEQWLFGAGAASVVVTGLLFALPKPKKRRRR
jgi:hypothetical protein